MCARLLCSSHRLLLAVPAQLCLRGLEHAENGWCIQGSAQALGSFCACVWARCLHVLSVCVCAAVRIHLCRVSVAECAIVGIFCVAASGLLGQGHACT